MLRRIPKYKAVFAACIISFILVLGGWLWTYFALRGTSTPLVIHFNNLKGINQVGYLKDLIAIGGFGLVMVVMNFLVAFTLEERDWFLGKFVAAVTFALCTLIFIGFATIISINS